MSYLSEKTAWAVSPPSNNPVATGHVSAAAPIGAGRRHFLLICGPFGPFTKRLAALLRDGGARCSRVLLNSGDVYDWGLSEGRPYFGDYRGWFDWLSTVIARDGITDLVLYGDSHPYCVEAKRAAALHHIRVHVLEQGYFRPFWITLERDGVNAYSSLPRSPEDYLRLEAPNPPDPQWLPPLTPPAVFRIFFYHAALLIGKPFFPKYRLPYRVPFLRQAGGHIVRYFDQKLFRARHKRRLAAFMEAPGPVVVAILQRPGDSQLVMHSPFASIAEFIEAVLASFAENAPRDARLLFKAHPLDHGLERHGRAIASIAERLNVSDRVFFADGGDLQALLVRAQGAVTVNSTAGLAAIELGLPTKVLGSAIYDMPGLTHQGTLDDFWTSAAPPDPALYQAFRRVVVAQTQVNGAYATRRGVDLAAPEVARRLLADPAPAS